jgi:hypothetical protein
MLLSLGLVVWASKPVMEFEAACGVIWKLASR